MVHANVAAKPVEDFDAHLPLMAPFHRRYMSGKLVCRLWAQMVRGLDIEWIVPQHGQPFAGQPWSSGSSIGWKRSIAAST